MNPDCVIIELPSLLDYNYPSKLISNSDLVLMVCRANRLWSKADNNILKKLKTIVSDKLQFVINGVELNEVEAILGDLPMKRSNFRTTIKNIIDFQFFTSHRI